MEHRETGNGESDRTESEELEELEKLRQEIKKLALNEREKIAKENIQTLIKQERNHIQRATEKNEDQTTDRNPPTPREPQDTSNHKRSNQRSEETENPNIKRTRRREEQSSDEKHEKLRAADNKEKTENEDAPEPSEKEEKLLEITKYEKPTVLISDTISSFTLFPENVLNKVIEAKNKSKPEGNNDVLQACNKTLKQFHEEGCINATRLNTIARYLKKPYRETSPATEAETVLDTYASEIRKTEELLQLLDAKYNKTPEGLSVLEPLEPYERINIPQKQLEEINEKLNKTKTPETIEKLYEELEKKGIPKNVEREKLESYLRTGKKVPVDIYLKTCHTLGIEADQSVVTRWRSPTVDIATGKWYSRPDVAVRIQPDELKNLYEELLNKLKSEEISLDRFATILADAGAASARGRDVKEILNKRYVDTITLSEICTFLGKEPSQIRELDQNNMSKEERVYPSRKNIRRIRQEAWKKYGYNYPSELAKDIKISSVDIKHYILDERKIPIGVLEKIEETLGIKISDRLHERIKTRFKDYKREIIREKDGTEVAIEKIEINEPKEGKRTILTLIHRKGKDGSIIREVEQTGEKFDPTKTLWFFSLPNTHVTVDRTKEFKEGEDLLTYITEKSIKKAGNLSKAEKVLDISSSTLNRWLRNKESGTLFLVNLLTLTMYSGAVDKLTELTDYIEKVGPMEKKNKPNLTIEMKGEDAAYIVMSTVFGDGTFRKRGRGHEIAYFNMQADFMEPMKKKMKNVFGITPSAGKKEDGSYYLYVYSNLPAISFLGIGLIPGEKTIINQEFPESIIEGSQEREAVTKAMITDEGSIEQHSQLSILLTVRAPELEEHRNTLSQIKGTTLRGIKGEILGKFIAIGKLEDYKEIQTKAENKEIKVLKYKKKIMSKLLEENGISLEKDDIQIKTPGINLYSDHIAISKELTLTVEATEKLHKILGGFPGFKELMYANRATVWRSIPMKPINLNVEEMGTLKRIGTQRIIHSEICYIIPVEKLHKKLEGYTNPPDEILKLQKKYSEEEIEILIEGKPVKVKGMPSRIRGEIRLYPNRNVIFWTLTPALQKTIKEKWQRLNPLLRKEITEEEEKEKENT